MKVHSPEIATAKASHLYQLAKTNMSFVETQNKEQPQKHEAQQGSLGIRASGASWRKQGFEGAVKLHLITSSTMCQGKHVQEQEEFPGKVTPHCSQISAQPSWNAESISKACPLFLRFFMAIASLG